MTNATDSSRVYEPREDSFLLEQTIGKFQEEFLGKKVLDMGTGSGILAREAAKYARNVVAADRNSNAIAFCKKAANFKNIIFVKSDLFSNIHERFDIMIFNPPYLPNHAQVKDMALDGGRFGHELTARFLKSAEKYLNSGGKIFLLISSYTGIKKIEDLARGLDFKYVIIGEKKLDFETLHVYLLEKEHSKNPQILRNYALKNKEYFSKGKRGIVYKAKLGRKIVAVKEKRIESKAQGAIEKEAKWLLILNKHGIGPKLLNIQPGSLITQFIEGKQIMEFLQDANKKDILKVLRNIFAQCHKLDKLGISKMEMTMPRKHIIVTKKLKPIMIDFERARRSSRPKNVTQFCQFITLEAVSKILREKGIRIDKGEVIELAKEYKKKPSMENFNTIKHLLQR